MSGHEIIIPPLDIPNNPAGLPLGQTAISPMRAIGTGPYTYNFPTDGPLLTEQWLITQMSLVIGIVAPGATATPTVAHLDLRLMRQSAIPLWDLHGDFSLTATGGTNAATTITATQDFTNPIEVPGPSSLSFLQSVSFDQTVLIGYGALIGLTSDLQAIPGLITVQISPAF